MLNDGAGDRIDLGGHFCLVIHAPGMRMLTYLILVSAEV